MVKVTHGMALRGAISAAEDLGCTIESVRRTGEARVTHPAVSYTVIFNVRRKDAPRRLTAFLLRLPGAER